MYDYKVVNKKEYSLTNYRVNTRRGVIWIGQTCNLRCYFCYFSNKISTKNHPEHPFFNINKAKQICKILRNHYGLSSIDIQGGEPTIYKNIFHLIDFCNDIGLRPSLITNGLALSDKNHCNKFKEHRVRDFLVSMHSTGKDYDKIVRRKGAYEKQIIGINNIYDNNIPIRINTVLTKESRNSIDDLTEIALKYKARVVNYLGFNNTGDQAKRSTNVIPTYKKIIEKILPIVDLLEENKTEVNLRFIPFCVVPRKYRKNIQNLKQKIYDIHEWEVSSRSWIDRKPQREKKRSTEKPISPLWAIIKLRLKNNPSGMLNQFNPIAYFDTFAPSHKYESKINQLMKFYVPATKLKQFSKIENYYFEYLSLMNEKIYIDPCTQCDLINICDGVYPDYAKVFFDEEISPVKIGETITDPTYYSKLQMKVVDKDDYNWALPC